GTCRNLRNSCHHRTLVADPLNPHFRGGAVPILGNTRRAISRDFNFSSQQTWLPSRRPHCRLVSRFLRPLPALPSVFSKAYSSFFLRVPLPRAPRAHILVPLFRIADHSRIWTSPSEALELSAHHRKPTSRLCQRPRRYLQPDLYGNGSLRTRRNGSSAAPSHSGANAELFPLLQPAEPRHPYRNPGYPAR